jgi:hypothetical protein
LYRWRKFSVDRKLCLRKGKIMPHHRFDVRVAETYGVPGALLIQHLQHWIVFNRARGLNLHDGRTWMFSTVTQIAQRLPYLSESQVRRNLEQLMAGGVLLEGNYHKNPYDRTKWYAFADEAKWICQVEENEQTELTDEICRPPKMPSGRSAKSIKDDSKNKNLKDGLGDSWPMPASGVALQSPPPSGTSLEKLAADTRPTSKEAASALWKTYANEMLDFFSASDLENYISALHPESDDGTVLVLAAPPTKHLIQHLNEKFKEPLQEILPRVIRIVGRSWASAKPLRALIPMPKPPDG